MKNQTRSNGENLPTNAILAKNTYVHTRAPITLTKFSKRVCAPARGHYLGSSRGIHTRVDVHSFVDRILTQFSKRDRLLCMCAGTGKIFQFSVSSFTPSPSQKRKTRTHTCQKQ